MVRRHLNRLIGCSDDVRAGGKRKDKMMCLQNHIVSKVSRGAAELGEATHHLWYLQVSAALTSSVTAPASLISSMITTRGSSPPLSLSIWLARSERYNCNSCKRKKVNENVVKLEAPGQRCTLWERWYLLGLVMQVEGDGGAATQDVWLLVNLCVGSAALQ